jgi:hypothetical protein
MGDAENGSADSYFFSGAGDQEHRQVFGTDRRQTSNSGDDLCSEVGHGPKPTKDIDYQSQRGLRIAGQPFSGTRGTYKGNLACTRSWGTGSGFSRCAEQYLW